MNNSPEATSRSDSLGQPQNRRYFIVGERRLSNYWWASVIFLGGFGFLLTGISSYLHYNIFENAFKIFNITSSVAVTAFRSIFIKDASTFDSRDLDLTSNLVTQNKEAIIAFFPQGLLMCFYGSLGVLLSIYWWLLIYWDVGSGFNEFNKKEGFLRIFRWGYPGKNRRIDLLYKLQDIEAIRVETQGEQTIYVRLRPINININSTAQPSEAIKKVDIGKVASREIPLGGIGQPLTLMEIEKQASELANFLQIELLGL